MPAVVHAQRGRESSEGNAGKAAPGLCFMVIEWEDRMSPAEVLGNVMLDSWSSSSLAPRVRPLRTAEVSTSSHMCIPIGVPPKPTSLEQQHTHLHVSRGEFCQVKGRFPWNTPKIPLLPRAVFLKYPSVAPQLFWQRSC